jgi:uncharacterized membrane protein
MISDPRRNVPLRDVRLSLRARAAVNRAWKATVRGPQATGWEDSLPAIRGQIAARAALGTAIALYVALFSYWTLRNHYGFFTAGFDVGIFDQGMWLLSRFRDPFVTVLGLDLFGDHTSFFLLLLVPFYWLFPSTAVLLVAQSVALGIAALPAFLVAREKLRDEWLAVGVAVAYLAHPAIGFTNFENFHPDAFEVPLVLFAIYFMLKRRWLPFGICVGLLLSIKEDVALLTFVLGIYVAVKYDRKVGLITAGVSALWFASTLLIILPAFNDVGTLDAWRLPSSQFGGIGGLIRTAFLRPWEIAGVAFGEDRPWYLWQLLAPVALLCFLAPGLLLVAIGPLLSNLLSTFWYQHNIQYHYSTLIVPVLVAAAVFGVARFRNQTVRIALVVVMASSSLVTAYLWGPNGRHPTPVADLSSAFASAARDGIELIPDDAAVSAHYSLIPHLTHRVHVYEFPNPWHATNWADWSQEGERLPQASLIEYVFVAEDPNDPDYAAVLASIRDDFEVVYRAGDLVLLRKKGP